MWGTFHLLYTLAYFPFGHIYIFYCQLLHYLLVIAAANKKRQSYFHNNIKTKGAPVRYKRAQLFRIVSRLVLRAEQHRFLGPEGADVQSNYRFRTGFSDM